MEVIMKSLRFKALVAGCGLAVCALAVLPGNSNAQAGTTSGYQAKYQKEKSDINNDLARIKTQQKVVLWRFTIGTLHWLGELREHLSSVIRTIKGKPCQQNVLRMNRNFSTLSKLDIFLRNYRQWIYFKLVCIGLSCIISLVRTLTPCVESSCVWRVKFIGGPPHLKRRFNFELSIIRLSHWLKCGH